MGKNVRLYDLARRLGIPSKELVKLVQGEGIEVTSHMSSVDSDTADLILEILGSKESKKEIELVAGMKPVSTLGVEPAKTQQSVTIQSEKSVLKTPEVLPKPEIKLEVSPEDVKAKPKPEVKPEVKKPEKLTPPTKPFIEMTEAITVKELAEKMKIPAPQVIKSLIKMGIMANINQILDIDVAASVADKFGFAVNFIDLEGEQLFQSEKEDESLQRLRSPVVTIMGHVDHGKTSLLDAIRKSRITDTEAGGITQHIGAYKVRLDKGEIVFLDTPGHEAFTAMRARGARVTDIVVLVVAADDGVMPQTVEAIDHAKAAGVPIIVAVNKIDKPNADPQRVKNELTKYDLIPEAWGGKTIFAEISAKQRINLDFLLEMILLQAEIMELKANPDKSAKGTILEARLDKGRGPVATVLVQSGTLKVGDPFVTGIYYGKVRAMIDDMGHKIKEAGPSTPVEVLGLAGVPSAGDSFTVVSDERKARQIAVTRQEKQREEELSKSARVSLEDLYRKIQEGDVQELKLIIKADVQGSVEAITEALEKLGTQQVRLKVIHGAVGAITETDVMLATASNAIILGFNVRPEIKARVYAEKENVDIRLYTVIYNAISDVKKAMEGLLKPTYKEVILGQAEIQEVFFISKIGNVAGCRVTSGRITRGAEVRLIRDGVVIYQGRISSLKRFKDDVREVASGFECGITLENYQDIKVRDIIEAFYYEEVASKL
jgi:translation initiation factor IF-2